MQLTNEQRAIITACATGKNLVVEAGAGSGKTSTMRGSAAEMTGRGLYLAYNRAIKDEAATKFPRHVDCKTAHGLAFAELGKSFMPRIKAPRQPGWKAAELLGITEPLKVGEVLLRPGTLAQLARDAVRQFCYSADDHIRPWHVPRPNGVDTTGHHELQKHVLPLAKKVWADIQSPSGRLKAEHDHYLKTFILNRPQLGYDFIILDEAQDTNPAVAGLLQDQRSAQIVAVGDRAQSIYAWRGARDAMRTWPADERLYLSRSFRFGPAVAEEANRWLPHCKTPLRITGTSEIPAEVRPFEDGEAPEAILCRTNATAVSEVMDALAAGQSPALVGGSSGIVRLAEACRDLKQGKSTTHPDLIAFESWGQVQDYCSDDPSAADLRVFVELIDDYGPDAIIETLSNLPSEDAADVVISTAHKAKGREWTSVRIADDFRFPGYDTAGQLKPIPAAEAMLAYVAVTRAQRHLDRGGLSWIDEYDAPASAAA